MGWKSRDPEDRKRVMELADIGMSPKGISRHLGIPHSTVRRWIAQRANTLNDRESFLDLRGRTSRTVSDPTLQFALSGTWR